MSFVKCDEFGATILPSDHPDATLIELDPNFNPNVQINFPASFTPKDKQDILPLLSAHQELGKKFCPGEVRLFKDCFAQRYVIHCTDDTTLESMLLCIVSEPCTRFVCSLCVFSAGDLKKPLSQWRCKSNWPAGLPVNDVPEKFARYVIVYTGKKFYIIDLAYFSTPPLALRKLLNDPLIVVTTSGWLIAYQLLQLLYAVADPVDPRWQRKGHQHFIFGNCRSIVDLAQYYEDRFMGPYTDSAVKHLWLFLPNATTLTAWIKVAFGYTFEFSTKETERYFDTCFPNLTAWPNLEDCDKVSDQQLLVMLVIPAQYHTLLFHFFGIGLLFDYHHLKFRNDGTKNSKSNGGRAFKILKDKGNYLQY